MIYRKCFQHLYAVKRTRIPPTPPTDLRLHRLERPEAWENWPGANLYPDYSVFYRRLAEFIGVNPENIVAGAGIEDLIRSLVFLSCGPGDKLAYTFPTCAMFGMYADIFDAEKHPILTDPVTPPTAEDICDHIRGLVKLLILPNPGQPVDVCYSLAELRRIAARCAEYGTVFAIDEAYHGFGAPTALPLIEEFENVVVLRTFSKAFGGAALRVGYAVGAHKAIYPLEASRSSGEIAGPSMEIAMEMMERYDTIIKPGVDRIIEGRNWLMCRLIEAGFTARGSNANHVLITVEGSTIGLVARLKEHGVWVKGGFPAPLDRHILVTAGPVPLMQRFYEIFRSVHG